MDRLQKISPSTSEANFNCNVTPKRNLTSLRHATPLEAIYEENNNKERLSTPQPRNPFEIGADSLHLPTCSPSLFATIQSHKKNDGSFRWSIEHMSVLYPADIDVSSLPEPWGDAETEAKAQQAIDVFFSQNSIAPSPWSSSPKEGKCMRFRKSRMNVLFQDVQSYDVTTQTTLSIPPDADLGDILGKYFTYNAEENRYPHENSREEVDLSNTSSLRRKLFVADDECVSPCKLENKNLHSTTRWSTSSVHMRSIQLTPASDVLSSSPITPRVCSDSCNILVSPPVSPIAKASDSDDDLQSKSFEENQELNGSYTCSARKLSSMSVSVADSNMSNCIEAQEANRFPSFRSEKLDSGYTTGSISTSQNMTSSVANFGIVSRVTPVMELMEDCELSNSASCDMSYCNSYYQSVEIASDERQKGSLADSCSFKINPWNGTSTPAQSFHS